VPVLRDIVILLCCRWAFPRTVFHFHASGLSEIHPRLPRPVRTLFHRAYRHPDLAIQPSELNPEDSTFVGAARTVVVPGGVPDLAGAAAKEASDHGGPPALLFVGVLRESKGLLVLVEAARLLAERGCAFELHLMGQFESPAFERRLRQAVAAADLSKRVIFLGVRTGADKLTCFRRADVFCYPTHFESESFGLVLLEAMQFELPVVATEWRGVPTSVREGRTGFLVPVKRPDLFADRVQRLLGDRVLAEQMGRDGRALYLELFTEQRYRRRMEDALMLLAERVTR
jgi:glycosyltransferase involved in cell wall biosynthesis